MRKVFLLILSAFVVIGAVAWLAHYLSTGTITIATNNKDDTITLQKTSGGKPYTRIAMGSLSATVKHGRYTATVKNGSKTTVQVIDFKSGHRTFRYSISLANLSGVEPVTYGKTAQDLEVTSDRLIYLDDSSHTLYEINNQNDLREINTQQFRTVQWADPSFGIGQSSKGSLYTITNGLISPLRVPFSYDGKAVSFGVSPDKKIYVSYGADVYVSGQTGEFKKIYKASSSNPSLAAGLNAVAVSDSKYGPNASGVSKSLLAIINVSGKKTEKNIEAERMAWSPNGQRLVVVNQSSPVIYGEGLRQISVIPTSSVVGQFEWLNNDELFYSSSYDVWAYSVPAQKIQLLASVLPTDSITGIYPNSGGTYVYLTTLDSLSLKHAIKRIGLRGQVSPDYVQGVEKVLPMNGPGYSVSLLNFSAPPTILIRPYSQSAASAAYIQEVQAKLQSLGLNATDFRFQVAQPAHSDH